MNCYKASVLVTAIGSVNWTMPAFPETLCVSLSQPQALVPSKVTTILTFILMISLCVCVFLIVELKLDMFVSPHLPPHISALFKKHGSFLFLIVHLLKNVGYLCCSVSHRLDLADCWLRTAVILWPLHETGFRHLIRAGSYSFDKTTSGIVLHHQEALHIWLFSFLIIDNNSHWCSMSQHIDSLEIRK